MSGALECLVLYADSLSCVHSKTTDKGDGEGNQGQVGTPEKQALVLRRVLGGSWLGGAGPWPRPGPAPGSSRGVLRSEPQAHNLCMESPGFCVNGAYSWAWSEPGLIWGAHTAGNTTWGVTQASCMRSHSSLGSGLREKSHWEPARANPELLKPQGCGEGCGSGPCDATVAPGGCCSQPQAQGEDTEAEVCGHLSKVTWPEGRVQVDPHSGVPDLAAGLTPPWLGCEKAVPCRRRESCFGGSLEVL